MCGIFGFIGSLSREDAAGCADMMSHRGPDETGLLCETDAVLAHKRLSILDLSETGKQPMSYADGRYWITFNGEIYNFVEIKKELESKGYRFKGTSDTEVILASFLEWKERCLDKFNGGWAFAIWDRAEKTLFLSRDRFGKKPLFYSFVKDGFAFASEMKAFFPILPQVKPNVNLAKDVSKIFQYEHTDECLIEGVKRFPAGSYAWYRDKSLNIVKWWNTLDNLTEVPHDYNAQVEQFRALFFDACKIRMRSDVPIGTALSGGLDSSAVISCLKNISAGSNERVSRDWQHAFIASFPGTPLDETYYAKKVTGHIGIKETVIEIDPLKYIDKLDDFLFLFEDNYITSPIPFMLTYNAIKSNNVKVSIDGHGADELFGGYPFNILSALNDNFYNFKNVSMILDAYYGIFPVEKSQLNIRQESRTRFLIKWYARGFLRQIKKALKTIAGFKPEKRRLDSLNEVLYNETHLNILPTLLRNYDRYSMSNGVEIRMPFMDHRIVSFAFSIPWSSKIRNGFTKSIVRDAMAPYMPQEIAYRRTKIGFNSPVTDWMRGPLKSFFEDTVNSSEFKNCSLIDPDAVRKKIMGVINNSGSSFSEGEGAWTMLSPYLWEKAVIKNGRWRKNK